VVRHRGKLIGYHKRDLTLTLRDWPSGVSECTNARGHSICEISSSCRAARLSNHQASYSLSVPLASETTSLNSKDST